MGFLFIVIYIAIVLLVIEINVILFTYTGLDKKIARFQVISMLTSTGFTTGESELIIDHPLRRRLGAFLILFGAFSLAVIISAITYMISDHFRTTEIGVIAIILLVLTLLLKLPFMRNTLTQKLKKSLEKNYSMADLPVSEVLFIDDDDDLTTIEVKESSHLIGKKLTHIINEDEDILVLVIQRGDLKFRKDRYNKKLVAGDYIYLYGSKEEIRKRFKEEVQS